MCSRSFTYSGSNGTSTTGMCVNNKFKMYFTIQVQIFVLILLTKDFKTKVRDKWWHNILSITDRNKQQSFKD